MLYFDKSSVIKLKEGISMNINITGIDVDMTDPLRKYVASKIEKLKTHFNNITNVHVTLQVDKIRHIAKADLHLSLKEIHATANAENMYAAIDLLIDKLDAQIKKHKEKLGE